MNQLVELRAPASRCGALGPETGAGVLEIAGGLDLHHGGRLEPARVAWRLAGAHGAPVIAALGGISAHRHVYSENGGPGGWWDGLVGPGRALDSNRYRILGLDYLGGSGASTAPPLPETFPSISTYDQAALLLRVVDHLGLDTLHAIVGASYGGMVALAFAERYPQRVARLLVIGAADVTHPLATAWRSVQRRMVRFALARDAGPEGLELARALAMATYRSGTEFAARFRASPARDGRGQFVFPVEDYLFARGAHYASQYRPESFVCVSESIDLHAIDAARIATPTTLVAVREDQLVPLADLRALAERLGPRSRLHEISSAYGHDAFLKDAAQLEPIFASALESSP